MTVEAIAVADSGPLISLARINLLDLIPQLCSRVLIPPAVWEEVTVRGAKAPGAYEVSQATWIEIVHPHRGEVLATTELQTEPHLPTRR